MKKKKLKSIPVEKRVLFLCEYNSVISVFVSIQSNLIGKFERTIHEILNFHQAENIFNHMGPNMARGWEAGSAGTKLRFSNCPVDDRTKQTLKVSKLKGYYYKIQIKSQ